MQQNLRTLMFFTLNKWKQSTSHLHPTFKTRLPWISLEVNIQNQTISNYMLMLLCSTNHTINIS